MPNVELVCAVRTYDEGLGLGRKAYFLRERVVGAESNILPCQQTLYEKALAASSAVIVPFSSHVCTFALERAGISSNL